jgi:hypothetical protein
MFGSFRAPRRDRELAEDVDLATWIASTRAWSAKKRSSLVSASGWRLASQ